MAEGEVSWYGPQLTAALASKVRAGMEAGGRKAVEQAKAKLRTPAPPHSRPGQPPHKVSGDLHDDQDSWVTETARGPELHVGVKAGSPSAAYAGHLLHGTGNMRPRPWLNDVRLALIGAEATREAVQAAMR